MPTRHHLIALDQRLDQHDRTIERQEGRQGEHAVEVAQGGHLVPRIGVEQGRGREPGLHSDDLAGLPRPRHDQGGRPSQRGPDRPPRPGRRSPDPANGPAAAISPTTTGTTIAPRRATRPMRNRQSRPDVARDGAVQASPSTRARTRATAPPCPRSQTASLDVMDTRPRRKKRGSGLGRFGIKACQGSTRSRWSQTRPSDPAARAG